LGRGNLGTDSKLVTKRKTKLTECGGGGNRFRATARKGERADQKQNQIEERKVRWQRNDQSQGKGGEKKPSPRIINSTSKRKKKGEDYEKKVNEMDKRKWQEKKKYEQKHSIARI